MRFRTRVFLLCFVPFTLLTLGSFWALQDLVQVTVREGLRLSLRTNHLSISRLHARSDLQNSRFLKVVGENASLKAGVQLLLSDPQSLDAKRTVEDQLGELCDQMGFDFMMVSNPDGAALAEVIRIDGQLKPIRGSMAGPPSRGLMIYRDQVFQIASVSVDQGDENLAELSLGERFDFSEFSTPAVLMRDGKVLKSSIPDVSIDAVETAFRLCRGQEECDVKLGKTTYMSLPLQSISFGNGYILRNLQNVDAATAPIQSILARVFVLASIGVLLAALLFSAMSSHSVVEPISEMISHLRKSESTGVLPEFRPDLSPIREIRELTASFNRAANAVQEARDNLQHAYVEFIGSLASALDARDRYTAGHSHRVSQLAYATAAALGASQEELEQIRIGSLLHDIGKIGISDTVLQKTSRLTAEEFISIQEHPEIGRRILEGVHGFAPYLAAVELHHENWDGTGYPHGLSGEATPLAARIIHVSDAYDAMTTDRPYRSGMSHEAAIRVLQEFAGRQFDPKVVAAFAAISSHDERRSVAEAKCS